MKCSKMWTSLWKKSQQSLTFTKKVELKWVVPFTEYFVGKSTTPSIYFLHTWKSTLEKVYMHTFSNECVILKINCKVVQWPWSLTTGMWQPSSKQSMSLSRNVIPSNVSILFLHHGNKHSY
jgi:hypothetical protein